MLQASSGTASKLPPGCCITFDAKEQQLDSGNFLDQRTVKFGPQWPYRTLVLWIE